MTRWITELNYVRQAGSQVYQDRVPEATKDNIADVGNAINSYPETQNEFLSLLINRVALRKVLQAEPDSVFKEFIGQDLVFGTAIEDIFVDIPVAENFEGDNLADGAGLDPFQVRKPQIDVVYHEVDRKRVYKITVQPANIKNAFLSKQNYDNFLTAIMRSLSVAVDYDLYVDGLELLARDGGAQGTGPNMYGLIDKLGAFDNWKNYAGAINKAIKHHTTYMPFMNKKYNSKGVSMTAPVKDLVLFIRADVKDTIENELWNNIFNNKDFTVKVKVVDEFIDGAQVASLIDARGLRINHSLKETHSAFNPRTLTTTYFSHVHRLVSFNPFSNAVKITATAEVSAEA